MLEFQVGIVGEEHLQLLWTSTDIKAPPEERMPQRNVVEKPLEVWVGGSPIRIHMDMVEQCCTVDEHDRQLYRISNSPEWSIATTVLLWHSYPPVLRAEAVANGWFEVPLERWISVF